MIRGWLTHLAETPWSVALDHSVWVWPLAESLHVLTLVVFLGSVAMMDLRLVGAGFQSVPIPAFTERLLPWTRGAFAVMATTGILLFLATPLDYYENPFFRTKMMLLAAAGLNAWVFHRGRRPRREGVEPAPRRSPARVAGALSLLLWTGVVVAGRRIPYGDRWIFPLGEAAHLCSLCVLAGSLLVVDLRLLGLGLTARPIAELAGAARRWLWVGLAGTAVSGGALLWFEWDRVLPLPAFRMKAAALPVALLFTLTVRRSVLRDPSRCSPAALRATAVASLLSWLAVAAAGRWIGFS